MSGFDSGREREIAIIERRLAHLEEEKTRLTAELDGLRGHASAPPDPLTVDSTPGDSIGFTTARQRS